MNTQDPKYYSSRNLSFLLYEVLDVLMLTRHEYFSAHDRETMDAVLNTAETLAEKILRPAFRDSDRNPPQLVDGQVKVHPALHTYYKAYCDSGLLTATFDEEYGGQQLPETAYAAADFIIGNAHNGFEMFTGLVHGAAQLLLKFASPFIIKEYASRLLDGSYMATMCPY
jgi:butyryl-CoA dehydrogenase